MSLTDKILKEFEDAILDKKIKNPKTGNNVKVSSALSYDDSEPVKQKALAMLSKGKAKDIKPAKETGKAVATDDKKNARSHKPKSNSYGISKECVDFLKAKGFTKLNVLPQAFVAPKDIEFNPALTKDNSDSVWVCKFPVILPNGNKAYKTAYTAEFMKKSQVKKYKKISKIKQKDIDKLEENTAKLLSAKDVGIADSAAVLRIILKTGLRIGSVDEAETGNLGVRTVKVENVQVKGAKIHLQYIGKSYQENLADIEDGLLAKYIKTKVAGKKPTDRVFECSYNQVGTVMDKINPKGINPKDLRTYKATETAKKLLQDPKLGAPPPLPEDEKEIKKVVKAKLISVFEAVSKVLNNTPSMAKNSYVHPVVITDWLDSLGLEPKQVGYKHVTLESKQLKEDNFMPEETLDDNIQWTSMDEMFEKYPAEVSNVDDSDISEDEMNDCEEYEIPEWVFDDTWELVKKGL